MEKITPKKILTPEEQANQLALLDTCINEVQDAGLKKLFKEAFYDTLVGPTKRMLTLDELIEEYGHVLEPEQLEKLKGLIPQNK